MYTQHDDDHHQYYCNSSRYYDCIYIYIYVLYFIFAFLFCFFDYDGIYNGMTFTYIDKYEYICINIYVYIKRKIYLYFLLPTRVGLNCMGPHCYYHYFYCLLGMYAIPYACTLCTLGTVEYVQYIQYRYSMYNICRYGG